LERGVKFIIILGKAGKKREEFLHGPGALPATPVEKLCLDL